MNEILRRLTPSRLLILATAIGVVLLLSVMAYKTLNGLSKPSESIVEKSKEEYLNEFIYSHQEEWIITFKEERMFDIVEGGVPVGYSTDYVLHVTTSDGDKIGIDVEKSIYDGLEMKEELTVQVGTDASYVLSEDGEHVYLIVDKK